MTGVEGFGQGGGKRRPSRILWQMSVCLFVQLVFTTYFLEHVECLREYGQASDLMVWRHYHGMRRRQSQHAARRTGSRRVDVEDREQAKARQTDRDGWCFGLG